MAFVKKYVTIIFHVVLLYGFSLVGEWLQHLLHIPLPGSIIGLLLLWAALSLKLFRLQWIESGAYFLLAYLPLYLIPATVGVMNYGHVFVGKGFLLIPITMISTFVTMWLASWASQWTARKSAERKEQTI